MYDFILMAVYHGRKYLSNNFSCHFLGENTAVNDLIEKLTALAVLCDQVKIVSVLIILKQSHNVGMLQLCKDVVFLVLIDAFFFLESRLLNFLNSTNFICSQVDSFGHLSKATLSNYL
jgi:hypothetical protein